ncbi:VOC family protein [Roseobacter sinensis]|uniref:VOC family protein n=1 Tax=Roseobacter sinensis TaxID=2931391 RepID=A0ABT3BII7_9RHOB|nr:VOC family protein [Roseobacter sp. WL0113]MCV3273362.1 VOC family protein [Roseobacter sp. WL0113]
MNTYINLPVQDLSRSKAFFEALGFSFNDQFCDDTALSMVIGETSFAMLLTHEKFGSFTDKEIADTSETSQVLIALQLESKEAVTNMMETAVEHGGRATRAPEDHGFMYGHAFADPDGHIWEPFWMDAEAAVGAA